MTQLPTVLMLIGDPERQEAIRLRLAGLAVRPIPVEPSAAIECIWQHRPISVVLDEPHTATAPDSFLEASYRHHVKLVTLPDPMYGDRRTDAALRTVVTPPSV